MLTHMHGSIFNSKSDALVNPVNCVGWMGDGVPLEFKRRHPRNYDAFRAYCNGGMASPGRVHSYLTNSPGDEDKELLIFNLPIKYHPQDGSRIEFVINGLDELIKIIKWMRVGSIAFPAFGWGLGEPEDNRVLLSIKAFAGKVPGVTVELWRN